MSESKENPLKLPRKKIYQEEANHLTVQNGGVGGKDLDVPTFMRKEQEKPQKLPQHQPGSIKNSKN